MKYIINESTYYLIKNNKQSEIMEKNNKVILPISLNTILDENCNYFGSSYEGRKASARFFLQINSKVPIILDEKKNIILFPMESDRNQNNIWFVYNNVLSFKKIKNYVEVTFKNNEKTLFLISYNIFKNQMIKCYQLIALFLLRK